MIVRFKVPAEANLTSRLVEAYSHKMCTRLRRKAGE